MAIKGRVGKNAGAVAIGDTTIYEPSAPNDRVAVSAFTLHNTTGGAITVILFESPNTTSFSGVELANISLSANASVDVVEFIGHGFPLGRNIIASCAASGVNYKVTVTEYTGGS